MKKRLILWICIFLCVIMAFFTSKGMVDRRIQKEEEKQQEQINNLPKGVLNSDYVLPDISDFEYGVIDYETELSNYGNLLNQRLSKVNDLTPKTTDQNTKNLLTRKAKLLKPCYVWLKSWNSNTDTMTYTVNLEEQCVGLGDWTFIFDNTGTFIEHYLHKGPFSESEEELLYKYQPGGLCIEDNSNYVWLKPSTTYLNWIQDNSGVLPKNTPLP